MEAIKLSDIERCLCARKVSEGDWIGYMVTGTGDDARAQFLHSKYEWIVSLWLKVKILISKIK